MGTCRPDAKGEIELRTHEDESTEAGHRDGPERSSEETSVMEVERKSPGYPALDLDQPEMGGVFGKSKAVCDIQASSPGSLQEGEGKHGAACVDEVSLEEFERDLKNNLYKLWNRMASGSYFPPPVKAVPIPKRSGGVRILGVPTVADRVAQMVVKDALEPLVEPHFHKDFYGYRPGKSAHDALSVTRERCWRYD